MARFAAASSLVVLAALVACHGPSGDAAVAARDAGAASETSARPSAAVDANGAASANAPPNAKANAPPNAGDGDAPPMAPETLHVPVAPIAPARPTTLHVAWDLPPGTGVNEEAPFHLRWSSSEGLAQIPDERRTKGDAVRDGFDVKIAPISGGKRAHLSGRVDVVLCDTATHRVCVPIERAIDMEFRVDPKADASASQVRVPLPAVR